MNVSIVSKQFYKACKEGSGSGSGSGSGIDWKIHPMFEISPTLSSLGRFADKSGSCSYYKAVATATATGTATGTGTAPATAT
jgi:hypothetical protein